MPQAQRRTVHSGDVSLAVLEEGDPGRPTLVFLHGYPDTKEVWDPVRARLSPDFHTVAYDVRGAGESTAPRGTAAYDLERLGDDLLTVLDATAHGRRVHLIGHDWGGIQGWEFATSSRFAGRLASFTALAAPSLDQVSLSGAGLLRRGRLIEAIRRGWRSWYILLLLAPGGPQLAWNRRSSQERFRQGLREKDGIELGPHYPRPSLPADGVHGANLYRRNIPRRTVRPRRDAIAHVPVQLIVTERDRYIPVEYYERAEQHVPVLRRRSIDTTHWAQLTQPDLISEWIGSFVEDVERGL